MQQKQKVKLVLRSSQVDTPPTYRKQLPEKEAIWGSCQFTFDPMDREYDWLVVISDVPAILPGRVEHLACPKENTILVTTEPSSITRYGTAFAKQFHYLITNQDEKVLPHPNALRTQTGNEWLYGKKFDDIISDVVPKKSKYLSTICSNKQQGHTLHRLRHEFTKILENEIPQMERFGRGYRWIETKAEAIDPFKFHVAIENEYAENIWTEKLADAFLGYAVPIYYGCPNVYDYFPEESIIPIDIYDMEGSIKKIKEIISSEGEYERRLDAVKEARRRVIEEYNLFSMINKIVESANVKSPIITENNKIYGRRYMRAKHLPDLLNFAKWKIESFVKNI